MGSHEPRAASTVCFFGTFDEDTHPRVQVLRQGLQSWGVDCTVVNAPLGLSTEERVAIARRPRTAGVLLGRIAKSWSSLIRQRVRSGRSDVVLVGYLGHFDVHLARLLYPRAHIVLDHTVGLADTAADRRMSRMVQRLLGWVDAAALRRADTVVCDTEEQLATLSRRAAEKAIIVPVGATLEWAVAGERAMAARKRSANRQRVSVGGGDTAVLERMSRPLSIVFAGVYTPLHGTSVIADALASMLDDGVPIRVTMIGVGQEYDYVRSTLGAYRDVTFLDWVGAADLPDVVASHDVTLGIFGDSPKAQRVVPNKVYQGVAARTVVVTSDTPPQRRVLADGAEFVQPGDSAALDKTLRELVNDPQRFEPGIHRPDVEWLPRRVTVPLVERLVSTFDDRFRIDLRGESGVGLVPERTEVPVVAAATGAQVGQEQRGPKMSVRSAPAMPAGAWLRHDAIRALVSKTRPSSVLEIGVGRGAMGARLAAGRRYVGVEPDDQSRAVAATRMPVTATLLDDSALIGLQQFDLVCAFEVLEHIEDDLAALREWISYITPGGHLLLSVPAFTARMGPSDELAGHFRRYQPDDISQLLMRCGLVDVQVNVHGFPLGFALENARNLLASRRLVATESIASRTAGSGRYLQPDSYGAAFRFGTAPFRVVQRVAPRRGVGLTASGRRPLE